MARADSTLGMRLSAADKAALRERARAAKMSVAAYVRQQALGTPAAAAEDLKQNGPSVGAAAADSEPLRAEVHHIDDLGPDTLRLDTGALSR